MESLAVARPVEVTERAFSREIAKPRRGQRRQMRIGQVRQRKSRHHMHPFLWPGRVNPCAIIS
jgi:hypothetical protein